MHWIAILIAFLGMTPIATAQAKPHLPTEKTYESSTNTEDLLFHAHQISGLNNYESYGAPLLKISPELRKFIDTTKPNSKPAARFRAIIYKLNKNNFKMRFDLNRTANADEAFTEKRGNCISFTALIVAIARDVGLEAHFNLVKSPEKQTLMKNSRGKKVIQSELHVNAKVKLGWIDKFYEFNFRPNSKIIGTTLTDDEAYGFYLNNLALESSHKGNYSISFAYIGEALSRQPDSSHLWNTLGYLYRQKEMINLAEKSFYHALNLDKNNVSAIRNLRNLHHFQAIKDLSATQTFDYQYNRIVMNGL